MPPPALANSTADENSTMRKPRLGEVFTPMMASEMVRPAKLVMISGRRPQRSTVFMPMIDPMRPMMATTPEPTMLAVRSPLVNGARIVGVYIEIA